MTASPASSDQPGFVRGNERLDELLASYRASSTATTCCSPPCTTT